MGYPPPLGPRRVGCEASSLETLAAAVAVRGEVCVRHDVGVLRERPCRDEMSGSRDWRAGRDGRRFGGVGAGPGGTEERGGVLGKGGVLFVQIVEGVEDRRCGIDRHAVLAVLCAGEARQLGGVRRGRSPRGELRGGRVLDQAFGSRGPTHGAERVAKRGMCWLVVRREKWGKLELMELMERSLTG